MNDIHIIACFLGEMVQHAVDSMGTGKHSGDRVQVCTAGKLLTYVPAHYDVV